MDYLSRFGARLGVIFLLVLPSISGGASAPCNPDSTSAGSGGSRERAGTPAASQCDTLISCPGEELVYEVSWLKVKLGLVRLKALAPTQSADRERRHNCVAYIDSYEGLPFVNLHAISHTEMNEQYYSTGFHSIEKKDDEGWLSEKACYDFPHEMIITEKALHKEKNSPPVSKPTFDTLHLTDKQIEDGLSILYFARANLHRGDTFSVPTIVYGKKGRALFNPAGQPTFEEIDALKDKRIRVLPFDGKAEFQGIFGFTGDFKGWFSDDPAAVPIKAELKVLLGSVKVELVSWKRNGWSPPAVPKQE